MKGTNRLARVLQVIGLVFCGAAIFAWWIRNYSLAMGLQVCMFVVTVVLALFRQREWESKPHKLPNLKVEKIVAIAFTVAAVIPLALLFMPLGGRIALTVGIGLVGAAPAWDLWLTHMRKYGNDSEQEL